LGATVFIAVFHGYSGRLLDRVLQKGGTQIKNAFQSGVFLVARICNKLLNPEVEESFRQWTARSPIYSPYYPARLETATKGKNAAACHRSRQALVAVAMSDCSKNWRPCIFDSLD
jgi:hypothetical protein